MLLVVPVLWLGRLVVWSRVYGKSAVVVLVGVVHGCLCVRRWWAVESAEGRRVWTSGPDRAG